MELKQHDGNIEHKNRLVEALNVLSGDFGEKLWSRSVKMIETIKTNAKTFQDAVSLSSSQRLGAQLGHLLAGYHSLVSDEAITFENAKKFVSELDFENEKTEAAERDEIQCLEKLLTSKVHVTVTDAEEIKNETCTVLSMLGNKERYEASLQSIGLRAIGDYLCISVRHSELSKIYSSSHWHSWATSLKRIEGAKTTNARLKEGRGQL